MPHGRNGSKADLVNGVLRRYMPRFFEQVFPWGPMIYAGSRRIQSSEYPARSCLFRRPCDLNYLVNRMTAMGEAKRKKMSGEIDYWYHGTEEYFLEWATPPTTSKYKPELQPHPFISLTKDMQLARGAGEICGGLCRAKLVDSAKVLDLRQKSDVTKEHWTRLIKKDIARHHALVQSFETWINACSTGEILRLHTKNQELGSRLGHLQKIANDGSTPIKERARAHQEVQNFTRRWIDDVITPAKELGYHAVICAEVDRYRAGGAKSCLNLYVFAPEAITPPEWVTDPNEALMLPHLKKLKELGLG